jgi:hypothetical protein
LWVLFFLIVAKISSLIIKLGDLEGVLVSQIIIFIYLFIYFWETTLKTKNDRYGRYVEVGEKVSLK